MSQKRYARCQKVTAYRLTYMATDGSPIEGESFEQVEAAIDFTAPVWLDADTGTPVSHAESSRLERLHRQNQNK